MVRGIAGTDYTLIENRRPPRKITDPSLRKPQKKRPPNKGYLERKRYLGPLLKVGYTQSFFVDFDTLR